MNLDPPKITRWFLIAFAFIHRRTAIVDDLDEAFAHRARFDRGRARNWYRRQAWLSSVVLFRLWILPRSSLRKRHQGGRGERFMLIQNLWYDIRHGVRALRHNPLFSLTAMGTLALGIGGTVALFSVMRAVLLEPPAYDRPESVVNLYETRETQPGGLSNMAYPDVMDVKELSRTLSVVSARQSWDPTLIGSGDPVLLDGSSVNADYFTVFGVEPVVGRLFDQGDGVTAHAPVVVISYGLWVERFGVSEDVIGQKLDLSGISYEVLGVVPAGFEDTEGPEVIWRADPPHFNPTTLSRTGHSYRPAARIAPGFTVEDVNAELQQINADLVRAYPEKTGDGMTAVPVMEVLVGQSRVAILLLFAAVSLLLVIASANVANLLIGRASTRRREIAVRTALGAAPRRLTGQLLTESLVLATLGGGMGVVLAYLAVPRFVQLSAALPRADRIEVDPIVLLFAMGVTLVVGVGFGLAPVWLVRHASPSAHLRDGQRSLDAASGWTLRNILVVAELALSVVLLSGAGLLVRSFLNLQHVDKGVRTEHVLTLNLTPPGAGWPNHSNLTRYWETVIERVNGVPGVRESGAVSFLPMSGGYEGQGIRRMDRPPPEHGQQFGAEARAVTVDYFQSIGISLVRGRPFSRADDSASASVIVINQTLADQLFPGEDPLGKFIEVQLDEPHQVVGVVTDAHQFGVASAVRPEIYAPHAQLFVSWIRRSMDLVVHTDVDPESVVSSVREAIWAIDASVPIANVKTMERWVAEDVSGPRFRTVLLSTFSVVALILAVVGIAGVLSYAVTRRTPEFGLRAALGASKSDVFGLVFRQGGTLTLLGCTLGAALSLLSSRFLQSLLFDMNGFDTVTMTTVLGVVVLVSMLSMSIPAIRAGRISPMVAMREG